MQLIPGCYTTLLLCIEQSIVLLALLRRFTMRVPSWEVSFGARQLTNCTVAEPATRLNTCTVTAHNKRAMGSIFRNQKEGIRRVIIAHSSSLAGNSSTWNAAHIGSSEGWWLENSVTGIIVTDDDFLVHEVRRRYNSANRITILTHLWKPLFKIHLLWGILIGRLDQGTKNAICERKTGKRKKSKSTKQNFSTDKAAPLAYNKSYEYICCRSEIFCALLIVRWPFLSHCTSCYRVCSYSLFNCSMAWTWRRYVTCAW